MDRWDDNHDAWQKKKIQENRVRRAAERQGYAVTKNRRRDPRARGYGTYSLSNSAQDVATVSESNLTLDEVEGFLKGKGLPNEREDQSD